MRFEWSPKWQWAATVLAVSGVVLNNCQNRWCFLVWLVSNSICFIEHRRAKMTGLCVRDAIFSALAIVGWWQWSF